MYYLFPKLFDLRKISIFLWGLGIGDWGLRDGANPQFPIPQPQNTKHFLF